MKLKSLLFVLCALLVTPFSFANPFDSLPDEVLVEIFIHLLPKDLARTAKVDRRFHRVAQAAWKEKVREIEALMDKWGDESHPGGFISLPVDQFPQGGEIYKAGVTQELWVRVMGNNPSYFKERKHCPDSYKEIKISDVTIGMCPDFPVDRIIAIDQGKQNSDEEFIRVLNGIYSNVSKKFEFRRASRAEYFYADTENNTNLKLAAHADLDPSSPFLGNFTPYWQISVGPSGEHQPRSILLNQPNGFGFRRAGVWEWAVDMEGSDRALVGGSWRSNPGDVASGYRNSDWPGRRDHSIGASRLVRTLK